MNMWWGHPYGFFPFFPLGILMFLVLCFIAARILFFRRWGGPWGGPGYGPWNHDHGHESILKRRLANGEITEEEYQHLRTTLKN